MRKKLLMVIVTLVATLCLCVGLVACGGGNVLYTLTFIVDDEVYATIDTSGEEAITMPSNPTKEDYFFDGWYWDKEIWQRPFTADSLLHEKLTSNMSVYAKWLEEYITKKSYTVTFNSMGGSSVEKASVVYNNFLAEPAKPTRTGYVFVGWYKEADCSTAWDFAADTVTKDLTLYAKWVDESDATGSDILAAEGFNVSGNTLSVKVPHAQEYFALPEAITVSPYATWTVSSDIGGNTVIPSATVPLNVGDNTYYINITSGNGSNKKQYTVNIRRREIYTVTYHPNNGDADIVEQIEEDQKLENKKVEKTGYSFKEWQYQGAAWDFGQEISESMTLTAAWQANSYTVTFDSAKGSAVEETTAAYDAEFEFDIPTRNGYTFNGWKTTDDTLLTDGDGKGKGVWKIADDIELTADWTVIEYTITYHGTEDATNANKTTYTVEDEKIALSDASKAGYTFLGWFDAQDSGTKVTEIDTGKAENVDLWSRWDLVEYNIHYNNLEDGDNHPENPPTYNIESDTITLRSPTRRGYNFVRWYSDANYKTEIKTIDHGSYGEKEIYAKWEPKPKVYDTPTISEPTKTDFKVEDNITPESLGLTAWDTYNEALEITLTHTGTQQAGKTITFTAKVTDPEGNVATREIQVKIYGMPTLRLADESKGYTMTEEDNLQSLFIVEDSFGQGLHFIATSREEIITGEIIMVFVQATDPAGNKFSEKIQIGVVNESMAYVELYKDDELYQQLIVEGRASYTLSFPDGYSDLLPYWADSNGIPYTDNLGRGVKELSQYNRLYMRTECQLIRSVEELRQIWGGPIELAGMYKLMQDLDLRGAEWTPLGTEDSPFAGVFDGNGYTIKNFKITASRRYAGLFAKSVGTISNLSVENFTLDVKYSLTSFSPAAYVYAGGLVGYNSGTIINCYATGDVTVTATSSSPDVYVYAGGLVGYNSGTITNCYATGDVTVTATSSSPDVYAYAGGLVGVNNSSTITNCYATGDVTVTATSSSASAAATALFRSYAGGLVGVNNSSTITNSYAKGKVTAMAKGRRSSYAINADDAAAYAGGLVGVDDPDTTITNSYATGNVTATAEGGNPSSIVGSRYDAAAYAGGLVGRTYSSTITNCYATGNVTASSTTVPFSTRSIAYAGGLVGSNNSSTITNCYRYNGQTVMAKPGSSNGTVSTVGTETTLENLQSESFLTDTLEWDASVWEFHSGAYPTLKF